MLDIIAVCDDGKCRCHHEIILAGQCSSPIVGSILISLWLFNRSFRVLELLSFHRIVRFILSISSIVYVFTLFLLKFCTSKYVVEWNVIAKCSLSTTHVRHVMLTSTIIIIYTQTNWSRAGNRRDTVYSTKTWHRNVNSIH